MKCISVIIVTYNSLRLIYDCVESIFEYNDIDDLLDVVIADNASDDQEEMFSLIREKFGDKPVKLFNTDENGGYGKGNNYGIRHTDADIVIVMNPDVRFIAPVFKDILKEFENPNLGMAGVDFIDGSLPYYFKPEYNSFWKELLIHGYVRKRKYDPKRMYMSGSLLIFDRKTFIEAGMYDEKIFMYYEEPDITNRILKLGKNVKWLKNINVRHLAHGRKFNQRLKDVWYDSLEYYCNKYGISVKKYYQEYMWVLRLKIIVSKLTGLKDHQELFQKTLNSLKNHICKM